MTNALVPVLWPGIGHAAEALAQTGAAASTPARGGDGPGDDPAMAELCEVVLGEVSGPLASGAQASARCAAVEADGRPYRPFGRPTARHGDRAVVGRDCGWAAHGYPTCRGGWSHGRRPSPALRLFDRWSTFPDASLRRAGGEMAGWWPLTALRSLTGSTFSRTLRCAGLRGETAARGAASRCYPWLTCSSFGA